MRTYLFIFLGLLIIPESLLATHIRAGEIIARRFNSNDDQLTYEITVVGYKDTDSQIAFGTDGNLDLGDGNIINGPFQTNIEDIGNGTLKITFKVLHTYSKPNSRGYLISYSEDFRNNSIININNGESDGVTFYVETFLVLYPSIRNSSPILTIPPDGFAVSGKRFFHNPGAFDPDGDSLGYRFTSVKSKQDVEVQGYKEVIDPSFYTDFDHGNEVGTGKPTLTIDEFTGDIVWDAPGDIANQISDEHCGEKAEYNIAFQVMEYRKVNETWRLLGYVERDMQIIVCTDVENSSVITIQHPGSICVEAGETISEVISASDGNEHGIKIDAFGAPFISSSAAYNPETFDQGSIVFEWKTNCNDVQLDTYQVFLRAMEQSEEGPSIVTWSTLEIKIVGPAPKGMETTISDQQSVLISWDTYECTQADSMQIWRSTGDEVIERCMTQDLESQGFELVDKVSIDQVTYKDDNHGQGLENPDSYRYQLVPEFPELIDPADKVFDLPTGLNDKAIKIIVYPNPNDGYFTFKSADKIRFVKVFNAQGALMSNKRFEESVQNGEFTFNLPSGIYYAQFFSSNDRLIGIERLMIRD